MSQCRRLILVLSLLATASPALADCNTSQANRLCTDVRITRLVSSEDGSNSIQISAPTSGLSCSAFSNYLLVDMTKPYAAAMYSHLLSAHLANRRVNVRLSDHNPACTVTYIWTDEP